MGAHSRLGKFLVTEIHLLGEKVEGIFLNETKMYQMNIYFQRTIRIANETDQLCLSWLSLECVCVTFNSTNMAISLFSGVFSFND